MKLIECDAKTLLKTKNIKTPPSFFIPWNESTWPADQAWSGPCYLKSQVLQGRRGKAGLVRRCSSEEEAKQNLSELRSLLSADMCAGFLCEQETAHQEEWFIACDLDPLDGHLRLHVSSEGGKEVSQLRTWREEEIQKVDATSSLPEAVISTMKRLGEMMSQLDVLSVEINPGVIAEDGDFVALDAKIELDDAATFRHPEWQEFSELSRVGALHSPREKAYAALLKRYNHTSLGTYVELDGTIAVILAGGGASLVAMDALKRAGGRAANYLELSGNPDPEFLYEAAKIVFSHPTIKAVWIAGSFANFTDIELTVGASLKAVEDMGLRVPVVIRRDGPGAEAAERESHAWAKRLNIPLVFQRGTIDLSESATTVVSS